MLPYIHLIVAHLITLICAIATVGLVVFLVRRGGVLPIFGPVTPILGRKLMHIATGPVFCLLWLIYPSSLPTLSRCLACTVPLIITAYFIAAASGRVKDTVVITTMSRTGAASEIFRGPLWYGVVHSLGCLLFWTDHPAGAIAIIILCVGDGVADIVGRRFGRNNPLPLNRQKSYAGSLAFIVCSLTVLTLFIPFMSRVFNPIPTKSSASIPSTLSTSSPWDVSFLKLSLITLISAIVEALPVEIDNITVFSAAALSAYLLI